MTRTARPEPAHVTAAYEAFIAQPKPRNIVKLAAQIGVPSRTVFWWQRRYSWHSRALAHDNKLVEAAQAERDEAQATVRVVKNLYQACKVNVADFAATVMKRHEAHGAVDERAAHTTMRILEMLHKDYADILSEAEPTP